ncbi:FAS-associated death domain protein-like [Diadema setosum]|uniref:FAS-associated death domain protein-like n=1 Tax=Diadema setosum TaxID=31175 RepID=UPI003B3B7574
MDPQSLDYKMTLHTIGSSLTQGQVDTFKFLCKDLPGFTQYDMDEIQDGVALMTKLEELDALSKDKVDFVTSVLDYVQRKDLENKLRDYGLRYLGGRHPGTSAAGGIVTAPTSANNTAYSMQNVGIDLSREFDIIVENIGRDWRQLARKMRLTEVDIQCITEENIRNLREQSRQCLYLWQTRNPHTANRDTLVNALRQCKMNYIADIVEGYIPFE